MSNALRIDERKLKIIMATKEIDTYAALAKKSGLHWTTISKLVSGQGFRSETLDAIANALEVNPLDLLQVEGFPDPHLAAPAIF